MWPARAQSTPAHRVRGQTVELEVQYSKLRGRPQRGVCSAAESTVGTEGKKAQYTNTDQLPFHTLQRTVSWKKYHLQ